MSRSMVWCRIDNFTIRVKKYFLTFNAANLRQDWPLAPQRHSG
jgi:hypothetical protein